jgi:4-hydroxybenzoate polyprenyltransferase
MRRVHSELLSFNAFISGSIKKETPIDSIFYSLTFIIIIRTFFEMLLEGNHSLQFNPDFYINMVAYTHGYLSWLCIFLTASILMTLFLKLKYVESLKLILLFSPFIIIVPLFDSVFTKSNGEQILYGFKMDTFLYTYLNCFNPFAQINTVTRGVRVEILTAFLATFYVSFYVFKARLLKALLLSLLVYTTVFFYGYLPAIYRMFGMDFYNLSGKAVTAITKSHKFLYMYLAPTVLIFLAVICLLYKENKENLKSAVSFLYPSRWSVYIFLLAFGFLLVAYQSSLYPRILNIEDIMKFFSATISITLLFIHAKILNDINDIEIDRISNRERPIAKNAVPAGYAGRIGNILLPPSFAFAIAAEISFIFYWIFILAASYVYSVQPLRLRRYYPIGHLILSAIGISVFLAGGALVKSYEVYSTLQHREVLFYVFLAFFFLSNVKDFKDTEGDKAGGVINILNYIRLPKTMGIIFMSGFVLLLYLVTKNLDMVGANTITSILLFFAGSVFFISTSKNTRNLEKLLLFSFVFLLYLSIVWLFHIT